MIRGIAVSLGALAMGLVVLRGVLDGALAAGVAVDATVALIIYTGIGAVAGWIADHLVRDALERIFRSRVEWYRNGLAQAGLTESTSND